MSGSDSLGNLQTNVLWEIFRLFIYLLNSNIRSKTDGMTAPYLCQVMPNLFFILDFQIFLS